MGLVSRAVALSLTVLLALAACAPGGSPARPAKLIIAVQPTGTPEKLAADAKEIRDFLEKKLGRDVELRFPTTYAGVVEALRFGHAQAAFMSAWPAQLAAKHAGAEVALAEVRDVVIGQDKKNETFYFSYWVVLKSSPIAKLDDLKGKRVAFPSQLSTSGYVAPVARLVELGYVKKAEGKEADAKSFLGEVLFAGGYAQAWEALKKGQVDAIVIAGDVSEKLYREVLDGTKVLEQQGPIPSHAVVFAKDVDTETRAKLSDALLELGQPENQALMRKFISGIFVGFKKTSTEEHLATLDKYLKLTGFGFTERID